MQIAILGRQPKLSLAELESLYGGEKITPISEYACLVDTNEPLPQTRLGGTIKSAKLLTRLENSDLTGAFEYLAKTIPDHLQYLPEGKLQFGVSCYGFEVHTSWLLKKMLGLKKIIKKSGRSVRIIENKKPELEAAQVLYNKLTGPLGWEMLLIKDGEDCILAQTTGVQNIDDYSKRDFDRPKRDSYVGMLPPKLAQIMLNLAVGQVADSSLQMADSEEPDKPTTNHHLPSTILDAFCGTGVVLQEALLMGYNIMGSDLSQKMVEYSQENLNWLADRYSLPATNYSLTKADATSHKWDFSNVQPLTSKLFIVCETYLGKPLTSVPAKPELDKIMNESNTIAEKFLKNLAPQIKKGTRLCLALPAWHLGNGKFAHLQVLDPVRNKISNGVDHLTDLGYNRLDLTHATKKDLIYFREDQIVARELTILQRI